MTTKLLKEADFHIGANFIKKGGTVAFRTETVYGLGADATNDEAVQKIFNAKDRPKKNPLIIHFYGVDHLEKYFPNIDSNILNIFNKIKSGLTVILPKPENSLISDIALGGQDTVAVRIPSCKFAQKFIKRCRTPIAAPSANLSSRPSSTSWQDVMEDLNKRIDAVFMGKPAIGGIESTVIKISDNKVGILRQGVVSRAKIEKALGMETYLIQDKEEASASPGTMFKHYSPSVPLYIMDDESMNEKESAIILCKSGNAGKYKELRVMKLGNNAKSIGSKLFAKFREAEKAVLNDHNLTCIIIEQMPNDSKFDSIKERIEKASTKYVKQEDISAPIKF